MSRARRLAVVTSVVALSAGAMLLAGGTPSGAAPQSQDFGPTGAPQTFLVPDGVFSITVEAFGAAGGDGQDADTDQGIGGLGGVATAEICVTPGETLQVNVGGAGGDGTGGVEEGSVEDEVAAPTASTEAPAEPAGGGEVSAAVAGSGGFNGGGNGGDTTADPGGGGGGASDVRRGAFTLADRLIVAGGGGGGGG